MSNQIKVYLTFEFDADTDSEFESQQMIIEQAVNSLTNNLFDLNIETVDEEWK